MLQGLLGAAYPGLSADGWRLLTRNWAVFFAAMAVLNELVWRNTGFDFWLGFKVWGAIPLTLLFAVANVPMLMRHGLSAGDGAVAKELPPEKLIFGSDGRPTFFPISSKGLVMPARKPGPNSEDDHPGRRENPDE